MKMYNYNNRLAFLVIIILINGCSFFSTFHTETPVNIEKEEKKEFVWPLPPDKPKIKYIKNISGEAEVKKIVEKTFWNKFFQIITGAVGLGGEDRQIQIKRPYGIVENNNVVYVADQMLAAVHILDFNFMDYYQIGRSNLGPLKSPIGIAVDNDGNIYVSDSMYKRIFIYNHDRVNIGTIGGNGEFIRPTGIAINKDEGLLYVVDTIANKVKVFGLSGEFKFEFGKRGNSKGDEMNFPTNIFVNKKGYVFICDSMNFKLKKFDKNGKFISMFGKIGDKLGYFARPKGVAVDSDGHIYVVESLFDRVQIFNEDGTLLLSFGKSGSKIGEFWLPSGIYIDEKDRIYVADSYNSRVQVFQYLHN